MQLVTNLDNADDIRASIAFLTKHIAPTASTVPFASAAEEALEDLRSRIGHSLCHMVQKTMDYSDWTDLQTLARDLGREYHSVRASFNSPLARALRSVKKTHPGAPDLFEWRRKDDKSFEFRLTPEMRAAIEARPLEFDTIPKPE
ncbi:MAG: hypothetical protein K2Y23_24210 [Cyanobacteria bacterium]|nr:hypothetical protein [Cyanobacteriota bacterium]